MHPNYDNLNYDEFRKLALQKNLSSSQKIGFPDSYRAGKENIIFDDISAKLSLFRRGKGTALDIGPGCGDLARVICKYCDGNEIDLVLVDSAEMLSNLPDYPRVTKCVGRFPDIDGFHDNYRESFDAVIVYSVIQYVFVEGNLWDFIDKTLALLKEGGELLIGDIPNSMMRKRFFSSRSGKKYHADYTGRDEEPEVMFNQLEPGKIDDAVVLAILSRARLQGFQAWVMPQMDSLPMANRREDILIRRP